MRRTIGSKMMVASAALGLGLALTGCGGGDEGSSDASSESSASASESPSEESSAPEESEGSTDPALEDYCTELEGAQQQFGSLAQGDVAQFDEAIAELRKLGQAAPQEVSADWTALLKPFDQIESALQKAGLKLSDLEGLSKGQVPQGADPQQLAGLATELQGLTGADVQQAGAAIEEHAQSECGITLSGS